MGDNEDVDQSERESDGENVVRERERRCCRCHDS